MKQPQCSRREGDTFFIPNNYAMLLPTFELTESICLISKLISVTVIYIIYI